MPKFVRIPRWASSKYEKHGQDFVCAGCLTILKEQGSTTTGFDMAPRVHFGRGWHGIGASHWFPADDTTVFPSNRRTASAFSRRRFAAASAR